MQFFAPSPDGATISSPSDVAEYPFISAYIFAFLDKACSNSSTIRIPPPPEITKPSLFSSKGLEAAVGFSLKLLDKAPIASNNPD